MRVFLAGEGENELGGWAHQRPFRKQPVYPGVIPALLDQVASGSYEIVDAVVWKELTKVAAPRPGQARVRGDDQNLVRARLKAREAGADVLVVLRDTDGDKDRETKLREVASTQPPSPKIVLGTPHRKLEAWILACTGETHTESLGEEGLQKALATRGIPNKGTEAMVDVAKRAEPGKIPPCATRLHRFLDDLRAALSVTTP
ncbi:MAG: hypothetical protein ACOYM9_02545 [Bradymonadia bacterium]